MLPMVCLEPVVFLVLKIISHLSLVLLEEPSFPFQSNSPTPELCLRIAPCFLHLGCRHRNLAEQGPATQRWMLCCMAEGKWRPNVEQINKHSCARSAALAAAGLPWQPSNKRPAHALPHETQLQPCTPSFLGSKHQLPLCQEYEHSAFTCPF